MELIGRGGQSKSGGEEGGVHRRMSLLTQKRGLISQGGLAFCSKADKRQPSLCPGHEPTKEGHLGYQRSTGQVKRLSRAKSYKTVIL